MRIRRGPARGMKWIAGSSVHGCWLGTYELDKQAAIQRFVRPGMIAYDIGAQAGFYTLLLSQLVSEKGRVYAFEPCPYEVRFLADHIRMNRLPNVRLFQAAVTERTGFVGMTTDRGICQNQICDDADAQLMVPSLNLDGSGLPAPHLIKMDVEGAESAVLRGAQKILCGARPIVFIALHSVKQREFCATLLKQVGYAIFDLGGVALNDSIDVDEIYALPRESISK
jgi:FkbM family methyltransferase